MIFFFPGLALVDKEKYTKSLDQSEKSIPQHKKSSYLTTNIPSPSNRHIHQAPSKPSPTQIQFSPKKSAAGRKPRENVAKERPQYTQLKKKSKVDDGDDNYLPNGHQEPMNLATNGKNKNIGLSWVHQVEL